MIGTTAMKELMNWSNFNMRENKKKTEELWSLGKTVNLEWH